MGKRVCVVMALFALGYREQSDGTMIKVSACGNDIVATIGRNGGVTMVEKIHRPKGYRLSRPAIAAFEDAGWVILHHGSTSAYGRAAIRKIETMVP